MVLWSNKKNSVLGSYRKFEEEQGLKNLITENGNPSSKFVIKAATCWKMIKPIFCFLKSCHLCHKPLKLDKEVYMYRGDLGFCSVECRERQMYMDEMKEFEISTKKLVSIQQRRCGQPFSPQNWTSRVTFSYS